MARVKPKEIIPRVESHIHQRLSPADRSDHPGGRPYWHGLLADVLTSRLLANDLVRMPLASCWRITLIGRRYLRERE